MNVMASGLMLTTADKKCVISTGLGINIGPLGCAGNLKLVREKVQ
jgi:hypothetical protein